MSRRRRRSKKKRSGRPQAAGQSASHKPDRGPSAGADLVQLVPRDPDWALAIWDVGAEAVGRARDRMAPPRSMVAMELRVYPIVRERGRRRAVQSYRIDRWIGERLVLLPQPGQPHQAAVGFVDSAGAFVPAERSELVPTPSGGFDAPRAETAPGETSVRGHGPNKAAEGVSGEGKGK